MLRIAIASLVLATACAATTPAANTTDVSTAVPADPAPDDKAALPEPKPSNETTLEVRAADVFVLNGKRANADELAELMAAEPAERVVVVTAEASFGWGGVIPALDHLRRHGGAGRSFVLAVSGESARRTQPITFPRASDLGAAPVEPPAPGDPPPPPMTPMLVVSITRDGRHLIGARPAGEDFESELRAALENHERVAIQADREAAFGAVIDVARIAQASGAKVAFAVAVP